LALTARADKVGLYGEAVAALVLAKQSYESGLAAAKTALDKASGADTKKQLSLEKSRAEFEKLLAAMKELAKTDCVDALAALAGVDTAAKALNALVDKHAECKDLLEVTGRADNGYLAELAYNSPPSAQTRDALAKYRAVMRLFHGGQYDACIAAFQQLRLGIAALKLAVAEADATSSPKAIAAATEFETLAGGKKLSALSTAETQLLVVELKKLPLSKQTDLLAALHGPSTELDGEGRLMQMAMYKAMTLDQAFKQEDQKKRDAYREVLADDTDIQDAVDDWNSVGVSGQPKVSRESKQKVFEKVLQVQSEAYDIPVPGIRWYDGANGDFGGFNTTSGIISLNTLYLDNAEEMINTILHENTHNYQDQLAKRYFAGDIQKTDPIYEQAKAFALTHHMDAYVDNDESPAVYKIQPEEMHAWDAGDKEAPALLRQLADAKAKR